MIILYFQGMKQTKVKLIRQMRSENEHFRLWKQERERELMKLRVQDRRRQNEMARMQHLHTKQQNVLKRKVEEAVAVNKRLKVCVHVYFFMLGTIKTSFPLIYLMC
jgi:kinesin family protein 4/21/27